jgi:FtsP/CotA-like multicopper oxidase with cupredoxin domain
MHNRRYFVKALSIGGVGLFIRGKGSAAIAAIPGATLNPTLVPKFKTPLLIPPVMPQADKLQQTRGKNIDYYEISVKQFSQQILPPPFGPTTVWGYGATAAAEKRGLLIHNAPSLTIEAKWRTPVRINWINDLVDEDGNYLPHLLPVDQTLHWANPPGGLQGRDTRPTFTDTPGPYTGPVPMVTHVHGAAGVGDESDGYAEAWYLPAAKNIPSGFAAYGTWYDFFKTKAAAKFGIAWQPGSATFEYPNLDRASTNWYHDHSLGMTRLNVYAGPAGFYIIRGGPSGDDEVRDTRGGSVAILPGPAPKENDLFPPNKTYYEIPIAIQDRSFNSDSSLFYPATRAFFDEIAGDYIPHTDIAPIWNPEFFGNMIMVNGNTWPFHTVEQRRYRFRVLNGCQSRFLILDFGGIPGVEVWQIGNEGGFLARPVDIISEHASQLLLGPAERADLILDFTRVPIGSHVLRNVGPDEPFGGGAPDVDFAAADPGSTGQIVEFRVVPPLAVDPTTPPRFLSLPPLTPLPRESKTRPLALIEVMSEQFEDAPAEALLGTLPGSPTMGPIVWEKQLWMEPVTENPQVGSTEVWELYNATGDAHPMHVHEVKFEVVNRQDILVDEENETVTIAPASLPQPPEPWETGFKDTVIAYPGQVTRIRIRFNTPGQYVWHCHIVEHEDNEMMRPYRVGTVQAGQPDASHPGH